MKKFLLILSLLLIASLSVFLVTMSGPHSLTKTTEDPIYDMGQYQFKISGNYIQKYEGKKLINSKELPKGSEFEYTISDDEFKFILFSSDEGMFMVNKETLNIKRIKDSIAFINADQASNWYPWVQFKNGDAKIVHWDDF